MDFSVVVPLHNEEANVERLLTNVSESLRRNPHVDRFEIICVNDGSTDGTAGMLERRAAPWLRVISPPARRGQSAALSRGIDAARYPVVGRLDGDLQTSPDDFELLLPWLARGFDCAHGVRAQRYDTRARRWASRVANAVRRRVLGDSFLDIACPLTVFRADCVARIPRFDSFHRYLPYLIQREGYAVKQVPVRHFPRQAGRTKYRALSRAGIGLSSLFVMRWLAHHQIPRVPNQSTNGFTTEGTADTEAS